MNELTLDRPLSAGAVGPAVPGAVPPSLAYDGRFGALFWLWLKVTLLSLLTLGFYRFWGRTRIRKYLWSRVSLDGERFEYDGTGGELFRRFLVTLVVLAPLLFAPQIAQLAGASAAVLGVVQMAQILVLMFLLYLGYYAGRRYRLSRTVWSGIRGGLDGHASYFALIAMLTTVAVGLTVGIYSPWQRVILWRYEARNTRFADRHFTFAGRGGDLVGALLLSYLFFVLAAIGAAIALSLVGTVLWFTMLKAWLAGYAGDIQTIVTLVKAQDWATLMRRYGHLLFGAAMAYIVAIFFFGFILQAVVAVAFSRFHARWFNYVANHTSFGEVRLVAALTGWRMFRLLFGNMLLTVLTLGLARPFVAHRLLRLTCATIAVTGASSLGALRQSGTATRPPAEGLAQLLDSGGFA